MHTYHVALWPTVLRHHVEFSMAANFTERQLYKTKSGDERLQLPGTKLRLTHGPKIPTGHVRNNTTSIALETRRVGSFQTKLASQKASTGPGGKASPTLTTLKDTRSTTIFVLADDHTLSYDSADANPINRKTKSGTRATIGQ